MISHYQPYWHFELNNSLFVCVCVCARVSVLGMCVILLYIVGMSNSIPYTYSLDASSKLYPSHDNQ